MKKHLTLLLFISAGFFGCRHLKMGMFILSDNPSESDSESQARGQVAFKEYCARCHGENADGKGPEGIGLEPPPTNLLSPEYTKSSHRIGALIAYGRGEEMPAFNDVLPKNTIWDLANYIHSLQKATEAESTSSAQR